MIRRSVKRNCACYDPYYGCLPLDGDCYMFTIGYADSSLCRYYEKTILPVEPEILKLLVRRQGDFKTCGYCGGKFLAYHNKRYCSERCAYAAKKKATARRVRNYKNRHKR